MSSSISSYESTYLGPQTEPLKSLVAVGGTIVGGPAV